MAIRDLSLNVPCPTCGVQVGERCKLGAGGLRNESHQERRLEAKDAFGQAAARNMRQASETKSQRRPQC